MVHLAENHGIPKHPVWIHLPSNFHQHCAWRLAEPQTLISLRGGSALELRRSRACTAADAAFQDKCLSPPLESSATHRHDIRPKLDRTRRGSQCERIEESCVRRADDLAP